MKLNCLFTFLFISICTSFVSAQEESSQSDIAFELLEIEKGLILEATNFTYADLDVVIKSISTDSIVKSFIVTPKGKSILYTWTSNNKDSVLNAFNKQYKISYYIGDPEKIKPNTDYLYRLPFKKGKKYRVNQSFHGKFSHHGPISQYAIDFQLEIGEPVHAAREGMVIKTQSHFTEHGGREYLNKANRIIIIHDDGTTASYVHLKYKGVLVKNGEKVKKGQLIGYSGLTGFTRGPHLHFVVRKERDIAIPIYFEGYENKKLKKGRKYKIKG